MKNKRRSGSLFALLARTYLLFTLTLLAIAAGVFCLWEAWLTDLYRPVDWDGLLTDPALESGDYGRAARSLAKGGGEFAVYDQAGRLRYASGDGFDPICTAGELDCVPLYGDDVSTTVFPRQSPDGASGYLLIRQRYDGSETAPAELMALDGDYQVTYGGFSDGRTGYTRREYQYLTGTRFPGTRLVRQEISSARGEETLLLRERLLTPEEDLRHYRESWRIWLLCVPLYLLGAGAFLWWLSRKIGRPLRRLNDAVEAQAEGRSVRVGECGGTWEIRRIAESFDRFADRLDESEAERRRLDQGRQKLIADISHDIKTPVTVIAGYVDAICDGTVPPQERERYLRAIRARAETLTELVEAFHEYSKVEHPAFVLHRERTDLCEFLRAYLAKKYGEIDLAGFSLEVAIPERPLFCRLDRLQFTRVLDNLLTNALRHNRLGTVLFFDVEREGAQALVRVADNGAGIPPEQAARLFEPFVVGSEARSGKGSGLGLSITRRIVEKHGGTIVLSPRPGPGRSTEFLLRLPLDPSPAPPRREETAE